MDETAGAISPASLMAGKTCVLHPNVPAVEVCIIGTRHSGIVDDFCGACIENGEDDDNFGRCYHCDAGEHVLCIGVPCQCECPATPADVLEITIAGVEQQLARLKAQRST